jgi:hypothetical protein
VRDAWLCDGVDTDAALARERACARANAIGIGRRDVTSSCVVVVPRDLDGVRVYIEGWGDRVWGIRV